MTAARRPTLRLYGHSYCSLCDAMHVQLLGLAGELGFAVELIDIHDDAGLEARFGERVPVLWGETGEICHHHLDEQALRRYVSAA